MSAEHGKPLTIGIVSAYDYGYPGGVSEHIRCLAAALRGLGHEVTVMAPSSVVGEGHGIPGYVRVGGTVPVRGNRSVARVGLSPFVGPRVRALVEGAGFDVIHYHEPLLPMLPMIVLRRSRGANVGTFHAYAPESLAYRWGRPLLTPYFRRLHACIAVSESARDLARRYFPGAYRVVPNGVDIRRFSPDLRPCAEFRSAGKYTLLFVGRLDQRKGLRPLLEAFAIVRRHRSDVRLVIVGEGPLRGASERYVARTQIPDVQFAGFVSAEALPGCYAAADVFCAPATGEESFGIVLLEAMATGTPIAASAIAGFSRVVSNGRQGLLLPPGDPRAWSAALCALLDDPARRRSMSRMGVADARRYDWTRVAGEVLEVYQEARAVARP